MSGVAALVAADETAVNAGQQGGTGSSRRGVKRERQQKAQRDTDADLDQQEAQIPRSATGEVVNLCDEVGRV